MSRRETEPAVIPVYENIGDLDVDYSDGGIAAESVGMEGHGIFRYILCIHGVVVQA